MRKLILIAAVLLITGLGTGLALASIPGPDGTIHGCYKTSAPAQGALITIDSVASCPSGYTALNWSQTGPQGPAGPTGATGPQGSPGISGYEVVTSPATGIPGCGIGFCARATAQCPSGKVPLSGGGTASGGTDIADAAIAESAPTSTGWAVTFWVPSNTGGNNSYDIAYAVCANVSP